MGAAIETFVLHHLTLFFKPDFDALKSVSFLCGATEARKTSAGSTTAKRADSISERLRLLPLVSIRRNTK